MKQTEQISGELHGPAPKDFNPETHCAQVLADLLAGKTISWKTPDVRKLYGVSMTKRINEVIKYFQKKGMHDHIIKKNYITYINDVGRKVRIMEYSLKVIES